MGNCVDRQQAISWAEDDDADADDDWASSEETESVSSQDDDNMNEREPLSRGTATTEVKIKITKKQLEKLLKQADGKDLTIQQVLADLMSSEDPRRHWKPALHSIPEVS